MKLEQNYELRTFEADLALVLTFSKKKAEMSANLSVCFMKKKSAIGKNERRRIILRHTYFFQFLGGGTHI